MLIVKLLLISVSVLMCGCWKYSIGNIDQPPPRLYETWRKQGKNELDIKKDLLECGFPDVAYSNKLMYERIGVYGEDAEMNHYYITSLCMENLGYKKIRSRTKSVAESCSNTTNFPERKNYPACQPGVNVPEPTEERRIKGHYCLMKRQEYNRCKIDTKNWSCGSNTFPLACYTNVEYEQYQKSNISPYPSNR